MPSPPRRSNRTRCKMDEGLAEWDHNSSNLDAYFVDPESSVKSLAASLPAATYSRQTSKAQQQLSRSALTPPMLRRRSPHEKDAHKPILEQQQVVVKNTTATAVKSRASIREGARRVVFRSPPPTARFPFFTRHENALPNDDADESIMHPYLDDSFEINGDNDDDERMDLSPPPRTDRRERKVHVDPNATEQREGESNGQPAFQNNEKPTVPTYVPPTLLHEVCRSAVTIDDLLRIEKQHISVQAAGCSDDRGQTPMHLLARNSKLSYTLAAANGQDTRQQHSLFDTDNDLSRTQKQIQSFVVGDLLKAYPAAMITCDSHGYIPFEGSLVSWVNASHHASKPDTSSSGAAATDGFPARMSSLWMSTKTLTSLGTRWSAHSSHRNPSSLHAVPEDEPESPGTRDIEAAPRKPSLSPQNRAQMSRPGADNRSRSFPINIALTLHAHFCFGLLSAILDQLDSLSTRSVKRQGMLVSLPDADDDEGSFHAAIQELQNLTVQDISTEIVQSIASIPDLVKCVLLIEDDAQRNYILATSIFRRVLVSKYSVGSWLTGMLQSDERRVSERAIDYLKLASDPPFSTSEQASSLRTSTTNKSQALNGANEELDELYQEVSRLQDFIPSLLSLGETEIEEAATTTLVRRVMDRIISRPFTVTVIFCDALFLAILIFGFRAAVNRLLLGESARNVLQFIYIAQAGIFYFIIRELGKAVSLCMITRRARIYFWSFWNLTDLLSTVLSLISTVYIRTKLMSSDTGVDISAASRSLLAVTTGFLWLRVLNFLKGINMQLATFVLAILQITRDILWFCVILLTLVVSFAQMFFTLLVPQSCSSDESDSNQECYQSEYYLKVYAILLGDFGTFERENFQSPFSVILVVVYSFMVVLVLLNVLIAVASDSYEKCLVRSHALFGRARVMLLAELVSFQNILRRNSLPSTHASSSAWIYKSWWSSDSHHGWSRGSIFFFSLSSLVVFMWIFGETIGYFTGPRHGNVLLSLGSILIIVSLFVGMMVFLSTGAADIVSRKNVMNGEDDASGKSQSGWSCYGRFIKHPMQQMLGSSLEKQGNIFTGDGWRGRLVFVQREMTRISTEAKVDSQAKSKTLESAISQTETRLRTEVTNLEKGLDDLRFEVREVLQIVKDRQTQQDELHATMQQMLAVFRETRLEPGSEGE